MSTPITWSIDNYSPNLTTTNFYDIDATRVRVEINGFIEHNKDYLKLFNRDTLIGTYTGVISETIIIDNPNNIFTIFTSDATNSTGTGVTVTASDDSESVVCLSGIDTVDELLQLPTKEVFEFIIDKLCSVSSPSHGKSAYQIALDNGFLGTSQEWIESLKIQGESAYQLAVSNGFVGNEVEWLDSLNGDDGKDAVVDYDVILQRLLSDESFIESLTVTITEHIGSKVVVSINKPNVTCVTVKSIGVIASTCDKDITITSATNMVRSVVNKDSIILKIKEVSDE